MEQMTGNVIIYEAYTLRHVSLRKAEKHKPCGELVATEYVTL